MTFLESCRHSVAPGQDETERLLRFCAGVQLWLGYNFYQSGGLILGLNAKGERLRHWANLVRESESFQLWLKKSESFQLWLKKVKVFSSDTIPSPGETSESSAHSNSQPQRQLPQLKTKHCSPFFRFLVRTLWKTLVNPPAWLLYSFLKSSKDHFKPIILYLVGKGDSISDQWELEWESHINENLQQALSLIAWALPPCAE